MLQPEPTRLIPRPSPPPVFDCLQCAILLTAKTGGGKALLTLPLPVGSTVPSCTCLVQGSSPPQQERDYIPATWLLISTAMNKVSCWYLGAFLLAHYTAPINGIVLGFWIVPTVGDVLDRSAVLLDRHWPLSFCQRPSPKLFVPSHQQRC